MALRPGAIARPPHLRRTGGALSPALDHGFERIEAFSAVQRAQHGGFTLDGVLRLQEAVGIGDDERRLISERLGAIAPDANAGAVLLGMLIGLFAASDA